MATLALGAAPASGARLGEPAKGRIELVAIEVRGDVKHARAPQSVSLALPAATQPSGVVILAADRRTETAGHLASYLVQLALLRPASTSTAAAAEARVVSIAALEHKFATVLSHPVAKRTVELADLFGSQPSRIATFATGARSVAAPGSLGASSATLIAGASLDLNRQDLDGFWASAWQLIAGRSFTTASVASLYASTNGDLPSLFDAPGSNSPAPPPAQTFGSPLTTNSTTASYQGVDFVLWPVTAGATSGAIPISGVVTSISVNGYYEAGTCPNGPDDDAPCEDNMHFQILQPQANGQLQVVTTSQAFTLPSTPGTYAFQPASWFKVTAGDYIGLALDGAGWVLMAPDSSDQTGMFVGGGLDMNGDDVSSTSPQSGQLLNMQETVQPASG